VATLAAVWLSDVVHKTGTDSLRYPVLKSSKTLQAVADRNSNVLVRIGFVFRECPEGPARVAAIGDRISRLLALCPEFFGATFKVGPQPIAIAIEILFEFAIVVVGFRRQHTILDQSSVARRNELAAWHAVYAVRTRNAKSSMLLAGVAASTSDILGGCIGNIANELGNAFVVEPYGNATRLDEDRNAVADNERPRMVDLVPVTAHNFHGEGVERGALTQPSQ
jgi:hypothetical protein